MKTSKSAENRKADECLFIDDSQRNVDGAIAVGMHSVLYHPEQHNLRELVMSTLKTDK